MIEVTDAKLSGVKLIQQFASEDHRGFYLETYNIKEYREKGINIEFVQDDISVSFKNVLRGIHGDAETWKLISCLHGRIYLVVVNCDPASPEFKKWQSFTISETNHLQVLVPPKFGNGHLVLSERAIFCYKQSAYYNPKGQFSFRWDNPDFNIFWPVQNPILSQRDTAGAYVC